MCCPLAVSSHFSSPLALSHRFWGRPRSERSCRLQRRKASQRRSWWLTTGCCSTSFRVCLTLRRSRFSPERARPRYGRKWIVEDATHQLCLCLTVCSLCVWVLQVKSVLTTLSGEELRQLREELDLIKDSFSLVEFDDEDVDEKKGTISTRWRSSSLHWSWWNVWNNLMFISASRWGRLRVWEGVNRGLEGSQRHCHSWQTQQGTISTTPAVRLFLKLLLSWLDKITETSSSLLQSDVRSAQSAPEMTEHVLCPPTGL